MLMEHDETMYGGEGEEEEHGVEKNEAANDEPCVVAKHHDRQQMARTPIPPQCSTCAVGEWDHGHAEHGENDAHAYVVDVVGIRFATLELKVAAIPAQKTGETDDHFAERRMYVKVEFVLEVMGAKLAKVCLDGQSQARGAKRSLISSLTSSHTTLAFRPIFHRRVMRERMVYSRTTQVSLSKKAEM